MSQTVLNFKLETTEENLTPRSGLAIFGEFLHSLRLPKLLDSNLPKPGSGAGYQPSEFVFPLLLMLHGGGRTLEDLRQISEDSGLRELLKMIGLPSSDAVGNWLRRMGKGKGLEGLASVNRELLKLALRRDGIRGYTLDIDATQIIAEKQEAKWTYKKERGYMPIVGHLAENGFIVGEEFREGNEVPASRNLEFIKHCQSQLPKGKQIANLRADSASYQANVINWCEKKGVKFAIGAKLDVAVKDAIEAIPAEDWRSFRGGFIAETVHTMNETQQAFRLIVMRGLYQSRMYEADDKWARCFALASNRTESAEATVAWYNQRGEASENRIKELKIGFGMERMPCGQLHANAMFFRIGVLSYNLFVFFKMQVLPVSWRRLQIQTLRWRFYEEAGKVVKHAGYLILKVRQKIFALFEEVRVKCYELAYT